MRWGLRGGDCEVGSEGWGLWAGVTQGPRDMESGWGMGHKGVDRTLKIDGDGY